MRAKKMRSPCSVFQLQTRQDFCLWVAAGQACALLKTLRGVAAGPDGEPLSLVVLLKSGRVLAGRLSQYGRPIVVSR